jgi:hypothetical protein
MFLAEHVRQRLDNMPHTAPANLVETVHDILVAHPMFTPVRTSELRGMHVLFFCHTRGSGVRQGVSMLTAGRPLLQGPSPQNWLLSDGFGHGDEADMHCEDDPDTSGWDDEVCHMRQAPCALCLLVAYFGHSPVTQFIYGSHISNPPPACAAGSERHTHAGIVGRGGRRRTKGMRAPPAVWGSKHLLCGPMLSA